MLPTPRPRIAGALFLAGGIAWMGAASIGHQPAWYGVGAAFLAIGISFLARSRRPGR